MPLDGKACCTWSSKPCAGTLGIPHFGVRRVSAAPKTDIREQLPTRHVLPPRRTALEQALTKGLISREEYAAGISEPNDQRRLAIGRTTAPSPARRRRLKPS